MAGRAHCLLCSVVLGFAVLSKAQAAAISGTTCAPAPNFFPPGKEDSSLPPAWTQTAQEAAGNLLSDQLYTVVLTSNKNVPEIDAEGPPVLYVLPKHDLLTVGATPSRACMGYGATVVASRHLLSDAGSNAAAAADTAGEDAEDTAAAAGRRLAQAGAVTVPARFRVDLSIGKNYSKSLGEFKFNASVPAAITLNMLSNFTDGYYCMNIKLTIVAGSGLVGSLAVPVTDLHSTTQVCFYKLDTMPEATVGFNTCGDTFSANITAAKNITPVPLFPGSSDLLFMPVYRFESDLNRTVDGSWPAGGAPAKMEQWVVVDSAAAALKPATYLPEGQYPDGFYNIRVESSLATQYPSLLSLGVAAGYDKYNEESVPEALTGLFKVLPNKQWPSGKVLGIQNELTAFISLDGPELSAIPVNAEISFNWRFDGFGKQYCWIDGLRYYNDAEFMCKQPLDLTLPNSKNHTLTILLVDVCSKNYTVEVTYSTWGYAITKAPKATVAAIDSDSLTGGQTFDMVGVGVPLSSTSTRRSGNAAGASSSTAMLFVPALLALLHVSRQAGVM
ncbi:hypothetical protein OEZ86_011888 [Tetradesmus obliquus]|nr:hypothetical protein OEZ86_011888 [Tetradesmus obliquus]